MQLQPCSSMATGSSVEPSSMASLTSNSMPTEQQSLVKSEYPEARQWELPASNAQAPGHSIINSTDAPGHKLLYWIDPKTSTLREPVQFKIESGVLVAIDSAVHQQHTWVWVALGKGHVDGQLNEAKCHQLKQLMATRGLLEYQGFFYPTAGGHGDFLPGIPVSFLPQAQIHSNPDTKQSQGQTTSVALPIATASGKRASTTVVCPTPAKKKSRKIVALEKKITQITGSPFECSYCGLFFKSNYNRKTHERLHTGETPYACCKCPAKFINITRLHSHELSEHSYKSPRGAVRYDNSYLNKKTKPKIQNILPSSNSSNQSSHDQDLFNMIPTVQVKTEAPLQGQGQIIPWQWTASNSQQADRQMIETGFSEQPTMVSSEIKVENWSVSDPDQNFP